MEKASQPASQPASQQDRKTTGTKKESRLKNKEAKEN